MKYIPILDPGHGKETLGKRSPKWDDGTQLFEWEFNRDIMNRIITKCKAEKVPYYCIFCQDYDMPLSDRCRVANTIYSEHVSDSCIPYVVSLHANAGGGTGWEIFTSRGESLSDEIATVFYNNMKQVLPDIKYRLDNTDGDVDKEANFYILKNTAGPAILIESMFMDTKKDCDFMLSEEGRDAFATAYFNAIKQLLNA